MQITAINLKETGSALQRVAIDLTPVKPGGENGGAKPLALELVKQVAAIRPTTQIILLTTRENDDELAALDGPNILRHCVSHPRGDLRRGAAGTRVKVERKAAGLLPGWVKSRLVRWLQPVGSNPPASPLVQQLGAQLLVCPFTALFYRHPAIPTVSVVHDLQFLTYPQFFSDEDRRQRARHFNWACTAAARIICPSEYVKATVLKAGEVDAQRVRVIHNTSHMRLRKLARMETREALSSLGLEAERYLLYPANFWKHKNHEMLLVAFGMFASRHPDSTLKLVLTGSPSARRDEIMNAAGMMGLTGRVVIPGYVEDGRFATLMQCCKALIFPSLYEGFGMPVLEAMSMGRPVLCSNRTALTEVGGNAAIYFDPRSPYAMSEAIEQIEAGPALIHKLAADAAARAATFGDGASMAHEYWNVFEDAARTPAAALAGA